MICSLNNWKIRQLGIDIFKAYYVFTAYPNFCHRVTSQVLSEFECCIITLQFCLLVESLEPLLSLNLLAMSFHCGFVSAELLVYFSKLFVLFETVLISMFVMFLCNNFHLYQIWMISREERLLGLLESLEITITAIILQKMALAELS